MPRTAKSLYLRRFGNALYHIPDPSRPRKGGVPMKKIRVNKVASIKLTAMCPHSYGIVLV
jgi:hypothetical protein